MRSESSRPRWGYNIKMDVEKHCGDTDCIHVAHDREQWGAGGPAAISKVLKLEGTDCLPEGLSVSQGSLCGMSC
jgi:hypothetical protein